MAELATYYDFTGGELGPEVAGRFDLEINQKGAAELVNVTAMRQGGLRKASGTYYLGAAISDSYRSRLIPFIENESEVYDLEFSPGSIAVWKNDVKVHTITAAIYSTEAIITKIRYVQIKAVMYIVAGIALYTLTKTAGDTSWSLDLVSYVASSVTIGTTPTAVEFHEGRLILAADNVVYGSKVGVYNDFVLGTDADDAWKYGIGGGKIASILWMRSKGDLIIGTLGGEYRMSGMGSGITPTNVSAQLQTAWGSHWKVSGEVITDTMVFVQAGGTLVREYFYQNEQSAYKSNELTLMNEKVMDDGIVDIAVQASPDPCVWFVTEGGRLIQMLYDKTLNLMGFFPQETDGIYESVCVTPGSPYNRVMVSVNRNGSRMIERVMPRDFGRTVDGFYVHSGLTVDGGDPEDIEGITNASPAVITITGHPFDTGDRVRISGVEGMTEINEEVYHVTKLTADTFSLQYKGGSGDIDSSAWGTYTSGGQALLVYDRINLSHLEGYDVRARIDGSAIAAQTVPSGGEVVFDVWGNVIHCGLPYSAKIKTVKMGVGDMKTTVAIVIRFLETIGCKYGPDFDHLVDMLFYEYTDDISETLEPFTGDKRETFVGSFDRYGQVCLESSEPLPMNILGIYTEVERHGEI